MLIELPIQNSLILSGQVVPVVMHPGDALFFTAHTAHYTPANVTESR